MRRPSRHRLPPKFARSTEQHVKLHSTWRRKLKDGWRRVSRKDVSSKQLSIAYRSRCTPSIATIKSSPGTAIVNLANWASHVVQSWVGTYSMFLRDSDAISS